MIIDDKNPTIEDVNNNLLKRLMQMIDDDSLDAQGILNITEAVAKLNASLRNNDKFGAPLSEKEKAEMEVEEMFKGRLSDAEVVNG